MRVKIEQGIFKNKMFRKQKKNFLKLNRRNFFQFSAACFPVNLVDPFHLYETMVEITKDETKTGGESHPLYLKIQILETGAQL